MTCLTMETAFASVIFVKPVYDPGGLLNLLGDPSLDLDSTPHTPGASLPLPV